MDDIDQRLEMWSRREVLRRTALLSGGAALLGLTSVSMRPLLARAAGGELTVAASGDIDTTDPHVSQLIVYGNMIRFPVFSSLVRYGPKLEYQPDLAEKWENPDDKTYIFTLRQGVKYHNGQALEASHVEFSFKRIAEKKRVFASRVENVAAYEVLDKQRIKISLKTPQADFIDGLVLLSIISPEIAATVDKNPIGTGPFKFVEWTPNDHISLERNPDYFESGVPGLDKLSFKILKEPQVAITNLRAGQVQAVLDIPIAQAAPFKNASDITALIEPTSSIHIFELMGKNSEPIRTSAKVRQALAYCLDKDAIQKTVFAGEGRQKWSWVPIGTWAYKDEVGYAYDPDKAKALLKEARHEGFEFSVIVPSGNPAGEQAATIWQAGLKKAGLNLKIEVQELSVWLNNYIAHTYDTTWNVFPGFADPNYFVAFALKPHLVDQWKNPEAAKLADEANATLDQKQRAQLYGQLQDIFVADLPIMVIQEVPQASLMKPDVKGWEINPVGQVKLQGVTVGG